MDLNLEDCNNLLMAVEELAVAAADIGDDKVRDWAEKMVVRLAKLRVELHEQAAQTTK